MSDPHYENVSLLLPMNGVNNGILFPDWSPSPKTITRFGDTKTVTAQSKYYGSSGYFDGGGDYLTVPNSADFNFASGDFTVEFWFYGAARTNRVLSKKGGASSSGWLVTCSPGGVASWNQWTTAGVYNSAGSSTVAANAWNHIAVVRSGDTVTVFLNGVGGTPLSTVNRPPSANSHPLNIGRDSLATTTDQTLGYCQDLRITNGVARYTADFTPPTRMLATISGTITDDTGAGAIRKVVAFPRAFPQYIQITESASDGSYTVYGPSMEHTVIALDDDAGSLYNDKIARVIPE
jgi:hypothetical protein